MVALWIALLLAFGPIANGLDCVQCNSSSRSDCSEKLEEDAVAATPCRVHDAQFCIKTTGIYGGVMGVSRFCSSRDHGEYCQFVKLPGDVREYRSCVYTCSADACNGSVRLSPAALPLLLIFLLNF